MCHDHRDHEKDGCGHGAHNHSNRSLWISFTILAVVTVANGAFGGYELHLFRNDEDSSILFADGLHNSSDMLATLLAALGLGLAIRYSANADWTSGFRKGPTLAAFINFMALIVFMLWAVYEGWQRYQNPTEFSGKVILTVGAVGLGVNLVSTLLLHGRKNESNNMAAVFWHHAVDLLSSGAVILAGYLDHRFSWTLIDPILTIAISLSILVIACRGAWKTMKVLLDATPKEIDSTEVIEYLKDRFGENGYHSLGFGGDEFGTKATVHVVEELDQFLHGELRSSVRTAMKKLGVDKADIVIEHPDDHSCPDRRSEKQFGGSVTRGVEALTHIGHSH